ncbi:hypothetical protein [Variovorax sp. WDL1]|nr:hypothetical protein [Variovorax sp. WDL1]
MPTYIQTSEACQATTASPTIARISPAPIRISAEIFSQQGREEEQCVDAQHHEAALGEHHRGLTRGLAVLLLPMQHDAHLKPRQHEQQRPVEAQQRRRAALGGVHRIALRCRVGCV